MGPFLPLGLALALVGGVEMPRGAPDAIRTLTATGVRVGDHPGFVRVVVDFAGARVQAGEVVASDPRPFDDGVVRLPLMHRGVRTTARPVRAHGILARVQAGSDRLVVELTGERRRFKYVGYRALPAPERLVIDLWKSAPPGRGAEVRTAPDHCLSVSRFSVAGPRVSAGGTAENLFENSLVVRLRRADGRIIAERPSTAANGRWAASFRYTRMARQTGTLEAVAESAKDGTLDCLVQARVRIGDQ